MDCDNGLGFWRNLSLNIGGVETARKWLKVSEDRDGLLEKHADHGADVRDAGCDHFVARRDACCCDRDMARRGPGGARLHILVTVNRPVALLKELRLLISPVVEGILLDRLSKLLQLRSPQRTGLGMERVTALLPPYDASLSASFSFTSATPNWLAASRTEVEAMNSRRETWLFGRIWNRSLKRQSCKSRGKCFEESISWSATLTATLGIFRFAARMTKAATKWFKAPGAGRSPRPRRTTRSFWQKAARPPQVAERGAAHRCGRSDGSPQTHLEAGPRFQRTWPNGKAP